MNITKLGIEENYPRIKYYFVKNESYDNTIEAVKVPTLAEYEHLRGIEPTKVTPTYHQFINNYVERAGQQRLNGNLYPKKLMSISVGSPDDPVIKRTEQSHDFDRWL